MSVMMTLILKRTLKTPGFAFFRANIPIQMPIYERFVQN